MQLYQSSSTIILHLVDVIQFPASCLFEMHDYIYIYIFSYLSVSYVYIYEHMSS